MWRAFCTEKGKLQLSGSWQSERCVHRAGAPSALARCETPLAPLTLSISHLPPFCASHTPPVPSRGPLRALFLLQGCWAQNAGGCPFTLSRESIKGREDMEGFLGSNSLASAKGRAVLGHVGPRWGQSWRGDRRWHESRAHGWAGRCGGGS